MNKNAVYYLLISALVLTGFAALVAILLLYGVNHPPSSTELQSAANSVVSVSASSAEIVEGKDAETGLIAQGDYLLVKSTCTTCHSAQLVTQNRATREGWEEMIRWMQETQKLWDLGETEAPILDYLAEHYSPEYKGRRVNLVVEEWYEIP